MYGYNYEDKRYYAYVDSQSVWSILVSRSRLCFMTLMNVRRSSTNIFKLSDLKTCSVFKLKQRGGTVHITRFKVHDCVRSAMREKL